MRVDLRCFRERSSLSPVTRNSASLASANASRWLSLGSGAIGPEGRSRQKKRSPEGPRREVSHPGPRRVPARETQPQTEMATGNGTADWGATEEPQGALEELLVEKIASCFWRLRRVLRCLPK